MANNKILIVEDDKNISKLVKYNLEKAGFECITTITGEDALHILDMQPVELIILDIVCLQNHLGSCYFKLIYVEAK